MKRKHLVVCQDLTADVFAFVSRLLKQDTGPFSISLAGGSTPKGLYARMATAALPWERIWLMWGDERFVPHTHADSNFRMVKETLLDPADVPSDRYHPWSILETPQASADSYELTLRERYSKGVNLMLLGMGDDGHTASLFPDTAALTEKNRWATANRVDKLDAWRLTVTYPFLALSQDVAFMISGAAKAPVLAEVLARKTYPSGKVDCQGTLWFFVDEAAAAEVSSSVRRELAPAL